MRRIIIITLVVAILAFFAFRLYSNKTEIDNAATYRETIANVPVQVSKVAFMPIDYEYAYLGSFAPVREVGFGGETQGKIVQIFVQEGDFVGQGQVIAKIDDEKLLIRLSAEQVSLENTKASYQKLNRDLQRYENLKEANAVSDIGFEQSKLTERQAELNSKAAEIAIRNTQKDISQTNITAPISGYLTEKRFEVGTIVGNGTLLGTITDISNVKLVAQIPEADILKFQKGQKVKITADVIADKEFEGTIGQISVKADASHNFKVEILVNNAENIIKAGMYGKLKGNSTQKQNRLVIPRSSLVGSVKQPQVFVAEDGVAKLKDVVIGSSYGDLLEIVSGLKEGEMVITTGQLNLENGTTIKLEE